MSEQTVTRDRAGRRSPTATSSSRSRGVKVHFPIKRGVIFDKTIGHVYAVDGVDLKIRRGETYGLVGESGCGKSTLGRAILKLEPPTDGSVIFDGVDIATLKGEELRRKRQDIQMVFQDPLSSLDPRQSVESLLFEGMKAHGIAKNAKEAAPAAASSCSRRSACPRRRWRSTRTSSPAASASASASPGPCRSTPSSSSPTSRSPPSTSRCRPRSSTCSRTCRRSSA